MRQLFELSVNFQFLQKSYFKSRRSAADHLCTNIESHFYHVLRQNEVSNLIPID